MLSAPTLNTWMNWYISQWDIYVDSFPEVSEKLKNSNCKIYFKKADDHSYRIYRQISQIIDLITLDINHTRHDNRKLIASCLFLSLEINSGINDFSKQYEIENKENMANEKINFSKDYYKSYFQDNSNQRIEIYLDFLRQSFNFQLEDILDALVYMSKFIQMYNKADYELPLCIQYAAEDDEQINNGHYEDFLCYQTHNKISLEMYRNLQSDNNKDEAI